ncbi:D-alanyl-D-alanine carboxypeptidase [Methylocella sp.]|uniref:D-alanyl-D-alanine carboxypeptidase n=1 Tax=Methylocella sp. TaxID=1978226 RepID=UPI0035B155F6
MFYRDAALRRKLACATKRLLRGGLGAAVLAALLALGAAALALSGEPAQARQRAHSYGHHAHAAKHSHGSRHAHAARPRSVRYMHARPYAQANNFAAVVIDANSGETLYGRNEDEPRHPASITKVMTLYLLFEELDAGRLSLGSEIPVSRHAAAQKPTKLGLKPGRTIRVEDAIKAIVTRSANDIAVAVAEAIGGDEDAFAAMMTRKARELGMNGTTYVNASGLPADAQITTARDLTILGRAIEERFPRYYRYFATRAFYWAGATIMNHNHLMERVEGMDGIKTGYTNASGFNLLTSVKRDGRYIVAVVMGGVSAPARDRIMADLIEDQIDKGSTVKVASALREAQAKLALAGAAATEAPLAYADARPALAQNEAQREALAVVSGGRQELDPVAVASIAPSAAPAVPASAPAPAAPARQHVKLLAGALLPQPFAAQAPNPRQSAVRTASLDGAGVGAVLFAPPTVEPSALRWNAGLAPGKTPRSFEKPAAGGQAASLAPPPAPGAPKIAIRVPIEEDARAARAARDKLDVEGEGEGDAADQTDATGPETRPAARSGWLIQVGAADDEDKAQALLARARTQGGGALAAAEPFTEKLRKGEATLYRARFAGLEEKSAKEACKALKKSGFSCFATKN